MCPPMVGITNTPKMGENRMMFSLGRHTGLPLQPNANVMRKRILRRCC